MAVQPAVPYLPYAKSARVQTGNIIELAQFEQGDLLSETHNDTEIGNEYYNDLTLVPIISEEEMDPMS